MADEPSTGQKEPTRPSLSSYIEDNHKLITVLGVFIALTVFARSLPILVPAVTLSFLFLMLAGFVWLELFARFPAKVAGWRLIWFENIMSLALLLLVIYWLLDFRALWEQLLFAPVFGILAGTASVLIKKLDLFNRVFRTTPDGKKTLRYVLGFAVLLLMAYLAALITGPLNDLLARIAAWMNTPPPG